ncbi:RNA pseudouridine synthase [Pseudoroseomonas wenyumeiae]|uniref:RNA pseudouridine synthase n=1 Tax=Teichococcus wenyumeiae TaxID=2478470 RepID=A0ABX9VQ41_9PROT|nr:RNA pseudouridine synthase [Pseudoroseomonas wenyumeiae]RMI27039.1 RNA pseudouridine synthase [Pseudoroseomonas wenyumeiae]
MRPPRGRAQPVARRPPPPPRLPAEPPAEIAARILLRTDAVLVLDKPAGLPVHAGPRGGASLEDWLPQLAFGKKRMPQPAHRLDTDTAGCLVLGRTQPALAELGALFAAGRAEKTYWAVVQGTGPAGPQGRIDLPLRKTSTAARGWRIEPHPEGQPATTLWRVLGRAPGLCWLELRPRTGRTHQLRVHCAALGFPILGDPFYGTPAPGGLHLLARAIRLPLSPPVMAEAPVPAAMRPAFAACGWKAGT